MKLLIFLMLFIAVALSQQTCTDQLYKQYLTNFSKPEPTDAQLWAKKKARFCQVLNQILSTNGQNLGYTLAINQFSDLLQEQLAKIVSVSFNPATLAQRGPSVNLQRVGVNAASINWNTAGKVTSIKDQGSCGCCWAFTVTGLYESFLLVQGAGSFDLAQEYILQCTTPYTHNVLGTNYQSNCNGGYVDDSGSLAHHYGIPLQSTFPYLGGPFGSSASTPTTSNICNADTTVMYNADPSVTSYLYYQNISDLQLQTLLNYAPVGVLIYADSGFMSYSSGIYSGCPAFTTSYSNINHAVILIGYDASGNWIIKNQWNTGWGESGFARISGTNNCALNAWVYQYSSTTPFSGSTSYTVTSFFTTTTKFQKNYTPMLFLALFLLMSIIL